MDEKDVLVAVAPKPPQSVDSDIKLELFDRQTYLRCCSGGTCDRRFLVFMMSALLTTSVAFFSMAQLYLSSKCDNEIYVALLTMAISVWIPSPAPGIPTQKNNMRM